MFVLSAFCSLFWAQPPAYAAHTDEEIQAFIQSQKQARADFNKVLLAEIEPRTAAFAQFRQQEQAARLSFTTSLPVHPTAADLQSLQQFNADERQKRLDFQATLAAIPKSNWELAIANKDDQAKSAIQNDQAQRRKQFNDQQVQQFLDFTAS